MNLSIDSRVFISYPKKDDDIFSYDHLQNSHFVLTTFVSVDWQNTKIGQVWSFGFKGEHGYPQRPSPEEEENLICNALLKQGSTLNNPYLWPIFQTREEIISEDCLDEKRSIENTSIALEVTDKLEKHFTQKSEKIKSLKQSWDVAKDFLSKAPEIGLHYHQDIRLVRDALHFVTSVMDSSGDPCLGNWNREKSARLKSAIDEIIRRKKMNHPRYHSAAEEIKTITYDISFPDYWLHEVYSREFK